MSILSSSARGLLYGVAIGDALGAPVENASPAAVRLRYPDGVREIVSGATDDTGQMLALARSIDETGDYDDRVAIRHYVRWLIEDGWGIGSNSRYVLGAARDGLDARAAAAEFAEIRPDRPPSNGCLMRSAPIALRYALDERLDAVSESDASLTHHHQIAHDVCVVYNRILAMALRGEELDWEAASADRPDTVEYATADEQYAAELAGTMRGWVVVPLAVARAADRRGEDAEATLAWVCSLGGDTDTNAAIVSSLWGARYGVETFPARWLNRVADPEIERLAKRLRG